MTKWDYVKLGSIAFFLGAVFFWKEHAEKSETYFKELLNDELGAHYYGFVVRKYHDNRNHSAPILVFKDSSKVSVGDEYWEKIIPGDSVLKIKGSAYIFVYSNDSLKYKFHCTRYIEGKLRGATLK